MLSTIGFRVFCLPACSLCKSRLKYKKATWFLTLREEHRLRVFENRVPRTIFESKTDEVKEQWRKLHNGELHNLHSSPDNSRQVKSRTMRWAGHEARMGERKNLYKV
jgi:hypothetical protein